MREYDNIYFFKKRTEQQRILKHTRCTTAKKILLEQKKNYLLFLYLQELENSMSLNKYFK